jgi:DNA-binding transcriptional LysR family regulator
VNVSVELRQLRYFVAVAEELHFGRAAERLHMSQSPLSRSIRELERDLGVVLFVRTTRRVELTAAGSVLLERARRALAEIDGAIAAAQRAAGVDGEVLRIGYGPLSREIGTRVADAIRTDLPERDLLLEEEVTPESLRRVGAHQLTAAVVLQTPAAARRHAVRIDTLKDEPLLVALPDSHRYASQDSISLRAFAGELVLLPREPPGSAFNAWLRAVLRAHGLELERAIATLSAPWDRRMLPVSSGEAVSVLVAEWVAEPIDGVVALPFDPPLSFPTDLASCWPPTEGVDALVRVALRVRDERGWLTERTAQTELPAD